MTFCSLSAADNFPKFFTQQQTPGGFNDFDCSSFGSSTCFIPEQNNPAVGTDCNFNGLEGTLCSQFSDPRAGFVSAAYVNAFNYLSNIHGGIQDASNALHGNNFVSTMATGLQGHEDLSGAVFQLIVDVALDTFPVGKVVRAVAGATDFAKKAIFNIKKFKDGFKDACSQLGDGCDIENDISSIASIVNDNAQLANAAKAEDTQIEQQLTALINGMLNDTQSQLDIFFGPNQDPDQDAAKSNPANTVAFQLIQGGLFLPDPSTIPSQSDLAQQYEQNLMLWLTSRFMKDMNYAIAVDVRTHHPHPFPQR